jgi:hypothetical protein
MPSPGGATGWLNSELLGPAEWRGHVVLVDRSVAAARALRQVCTDALEVAYGSAPVTESRKQVLFEDVEQSHAAGARRLPSSRGWPVPSSGDSLCRCSSRDCGRTGERRILPMTVEREGCAMGTAGPGRLAH